MSTAIVRKSLDELQSTRWDELAAGHELFATVPWLRVRLSDMDQSRVAFLAVESADGAIAAGLPAIRMSTDDPDVRFLKAGTLLGFAATDAGIDAPARLDDITMPSLLCGGHQTGSTLLLTRADLPPAETAQYTVDLVRAAIDRTAELGLRSTGFLHVAASNRLLRETLSAHGFAEFPSDVTYQLDLRGHTFDSYVDSLPKERKRQVRRDLRALTQADVHTGTLPLGDAPIEDLAELMVRWEAKYGIENDIAGRVRYLRRLAATFDERALVFVAWVGGKLAGFSLFIDWKGQLYCRHLGFDYEVKGDLPVYFSTNFYQAIRFATDSGRPVIHYGQTSDQAKLRRGCTAVQLYGYVRCLDEADHAMISQLCSAIPTR